MFKPVITFLVALFLFGVPQVCTGDYEDEFPEMQNEEQLNAQIEYREAVDDENCPRCNRCVQRRWKKDRFLEKQFQETGWPGRRDELSDQLSR